MFTFPLIDTWRIVYQNVKPDANINYQSIESGREVKQFIEKTVDFGATDSPLNEEERAKLVVQYIFLRLIGSIVFAYNLP